MIRDHGIGTNTGQAWSVFFGVAAVVIGALVLISRLISAFEPAPRPIMASGLVAPPPAALAAPALEEPRPLPEEQALSGGAAPPAAAAPQASPVAVEAAVSPPAGPSAASPAANPAEAAPPPAPPLQPAPAPAAPAPLRSAPAAPAVSARSYAILERSCGAIVAGKDENARLAPASITKLITALIVAERANPNTMVDIRDVSAQNLIRTTDSSVMGVEPGMRFSVRDLLYGLILPSGNDAALALAQQVSGGVPGFVALMNNKAAALGMDNSHFANPHGLDEPGHYSTALDMAKAGRAYLANSMLAAIATTPQYEALGTVRIVMKNGNKLLQTYPGAFGVKIGFTTNAKQTMVAAANRNGRELVISLLASDDRYTDAAALLDWAFANTPPACR